MTGQCPDVAPEYQIPDALSERIWPLFPEPKPKKAGRPRMDERRAIAAIFYIARRGCQ